MKPPTGRIPNTCLIASIAAAGYTVTLWLGLLLTDLALITVAVLAELNEQRKRQQQTTTPTPYALWDEFAVNTSLTLIHRTCRIPIGTVLGSDGAVLGQMMDMALQHLPVCRPKKT